MKRVDRGVLRQEICNSLKDVFTNMLNPPNAAINARRKRVSYMLSTHLAQYSYIFAVSQRQIGMGRVTKSRCSR
jgi:seryl-tRNA(Sec) selenium transferase